MPVRRSLPSGLLPSAPELRRVGLPPLRKGRGLSPPVRNFTAPENTFTVRRHTAPRQPPFDRRKAFFYSLFPVPYTLAA